jgi:uncharacterized protein
MPECIKAGQVAAILISIAVQAVPACAEEPDLVEVVRNPVIGNYKGYAEFKMAHYDNARVIWEALSERGNAEANFNLGILHEDGLGVPASIQTAITYYEKAAVAGSSKAQYRLGLLYSVGAAVPKDEAKAGKWLTAAAAQGDKDAAALLARHRGAANAAETGRDQDFYQAETLHAFGKYQEAVAIWQRLAQHGDTHARSRLAWALEAGQGISRDLEQAARLFRKSAEDGDADAQYALAVMLQTGKGQAPDPMEAATWLRRAAAQGHGPANAALQETAAK